MIKAAFKHSDRTSYLLFIQIKIQYDRIVLVNDKILLV